MVGVSGSALSLLKRGQGFKPRSLMESPLWSALYPLRADLLRAEISLNCGTDLKCLPQLHVCCRIYNTDLMYGETWNISIILRIVRAHHSSQFSHVIHFYTIILSFVQQTWPCSKLWTITLKKERHYFVVINIRIMQKNFRFWKKCELVFMRMQATSTR